MHYPSYVYCGVLDTIWIVTDILLYQKSVSIQFQCVHDPNMYKLDLYLVRVNELKDFMQILPY